MRSRPGPKPKGDRGAVTVRTDRKHLEHYREQARQHNMPLSEYLAQQLAAAHNLTPESDETTAQHQLALGA